MICKSVKELVEYGSKSSSTYELKNDVIREKKTVNKFGYNGIANDIKRFLYEDGVKDNGKKKRTKKELEQFLVHILLRCEDHSRI